MKQRLERECLTFHEPSSSAVLNVMLTRSIVEVTHFASYLGG